MPRFIALLRGINVGKAKRVPMAELRALLSRLGYTSVATILNSGNAVFSANTGKAATHAARISNAISSRFQFDVPVIVKSAEELHSVIAGSPIKVAAPEHSRYLVTLVQDYKLLADLSAVTALAVAPEKFVVGSHAAYMHCPAGILQSKVGKALLGKAGRSATTRNWATILKLQALAMQESK